MIVFHWSHIKESEVRVAKVPDGVDREQLTVVARRVLLDGLTALKSHLDAITVVGAQAVYLRTPDAEIASAAYTSDGDLGLDPERLEDHPLLEEALISAGFELMYGSQPGLWAKQAVIDGKSETVELDLLVGESLVDGGRGARLPPHGKKSARKVKGIELAVIDRSPLLVTSLNPDDESNILVNVAGPSALLVAKAFKINDRLQQAEKRPSRLVNKDAGDVLRIMMTNPPEKIAAVMADLAQDARVGAITIEGLRLLRELFGGAATQGVVMATEALLGDVPERRIRALSPAFMKRLPLFL